MKYPDIDREESFKNKVARDFFGKFDCTDVLGGIDFTVKAENVAYVLWG